MNPVRAVILVLVAPSRFIEAAVQHDVEAEWETNAQWRSAYPDQRVPQERLQKFRDLAATRTAKLRASVFGSLVTTIAAIIAGFGTGALLQRLFGPSPPLLVDGLQVVGAAVFLSATLAEAGREIESWTQRTLAEKVNKWVFRTLYVLGTFILVISIAWSRR